MYIAMVDNLFFEESREQSQIKFRIVAKYFWAWAKVIIPSAKNRGGRIAYIDLFAGPGWYRDGKSREFRRLSTRQHPRDFHCFVNFRNLWMI